MGRAAGCRLPTLLRVHQYVRGEQSDRVVVRSRVQQHRRQQLRHVLHRWGPRSGRDSHRNQQGKEKPKTPGSARRVTTAGQRGASTGWSGHRAVESPDRAAPRIGKECGGQASGSRIAAFHEAPPPIVRAARRPIGGAMPRSRHSRLCPATTSRFDNYCPCPRIVQSAPYALRPSPQLLR